MKSFTDRLRDFKKNKYALFLKTGNMHDINNMSLKDFIGVLDYVEYQNKISNNKSIPLGDSNKEMIRRAKLHN